MPALKLVRRNLKSGKVHPRPRGARNAKFEYGYLDDTGAFIAGEPSKRRGKPGRPKGYRVTNANGLTEIERIVRNEVERRLKLAKSAAVKAFEMAIG